MSQTADISPVQKNGMSLVELLVAMAIFTIIMSSVMVMFNTITGAVRRSYSTMDLFEATHGAIMAVERDVQSTFSAPATGADFHFYGEPNGFVFVGIAPNGRLGRLSYAVHADTSRMAAPYSSQWRGELMTLPVERTVMEGKYPGFSTYYPGTEEYLDVEVEVVYGLLLRYFEPNINQVTEFDELDAFAHAPVPPYLPFPSLLKGVTFEASTYRTKGVPWIFNSYNNILNFWDNLDVDVPRGFRERIDVLERCHYWLQMLNGPRIMPSGTRSLDAGTPFFLWVDRISDENFPSLPPNDPLAIWYTDHVFDQFWYDHIPFREGSPANDSAYLRDYFNEIDNINISAMDAANFREYDPDDPNEKRDFLWDHVVARDFAIAVWLLDPATGQRVNTTTNVVDIKPVFRYDVESGMNSDEPRVDNFNTLFNLNFWYDANGNLTMDDNITNYYGESVTARAVDILLNTLRVSDPPDITTVSAAVEEMTASHQFYEVGDPIQSRLPSAFEINLYVVSPPVTTGAPPDVFEFNQIIHIPSGFLRRSLAVD